MPRLNKTKKSPGRETEALKETITKFGARGTKLREPLVLGLSHPIQWVESRVDLAELAKLRWIDGWSRQRLASHYGRSLHAITNYCQNIRRKNFDLKGLTAEERERIRRAYQN
jgi:hypothetical protein